MPVRWLSMLDHSVADGLIADQMAGSRQETNFLSRMVTESSQDAVRRNVPHIKLSKGSLSKMMRLTALPAAFGCNIQESFSTASG